MSHAERSRFALTLVALAAVSVLATASCTPPSATPVAARSADHTRTVLQQHRAAVKITTTCLIGMMDSGGYGTGDVVSEHAVLTALHVVHCPPGALMNITVDTGDGVERAAYIATIDAKSDIALLGTSDSLADWFSPISIGPVPQFGDEICEQTAVPTKIWRCGLVQDKRPHVDGFDDSDGDIVMDGYWEFGNSGSSLYNDSGHLVGVMVMLSKCQGGFQCIGFASSLESKSGLLPMK